MRAQRRSQKNGQGLEGALERKRGLKGARRGSEGSKAHSKKKRELKGARRESKGLKALEEESECSKALKEKRGLKVSAHSPNFNNFCDFNCLLFLDFMLLYFVILDFFLFSK
jgi:hypothetical protein